MVVVASIMQRTANKFVFRERFDEAIAFGIQCHGTDRRPVLRLSLSACRVEIASRGIQGMSGRQYCQILAGMAPCRADVTIATVPMLSMSEHVNMLISIPSNYAV